MDNKLDLIVEATAPNRPGSVSTRKLKRVQASTRAKMLRGPSKKRPPELRPLWAFTLFFTLLSAREPNVPTRQHPYIKGCGQDSPKVHNQHEINDLVK